MKINPTIFHQDTIVPSIVSEMKRRHTVTKSRGRFKLKRTPRPKSIKPLERGYYADLKKMVNRIRQLVNEYVVPAIPAIVQQAQALRPANDSLKQDDFSDEIDLAIEIAKVQFYKEYTDQQVETLAKLQADKVNAYNAAEIRKQFATVLSVQPITSEPWLGVEMKGFVKGNVSLIKSISNTYFDRIESSMLRDIQAGKLTNQIIDDIEDAYGVSESRAALIARDQIGKFNGNLNQLRQTDVGVTKYIWSTSLDDRVRPDHAEKEGEVFYWNDPPKDTGHPGNDFQCRCTALPVFDE